jgi:hypothetical protein
MRKDWVRGKRSIKNACDFEQVSLKNKTKNACNFKQLIKTTIHEGYNWMKKKKVMYTLTVDCVLVKTCFSFAYRPAGVCADGP